MKETSDWKGYWEGKSQQSASDFDYDHRGAGDGSGPGSTPAEQELKAFADQELVAFIDPRPGEVLLDAGCGTGGNILLFHSRVKQVIGFDYIEGAIERCRRKLGDAKIQNVEVFQGSVIEMKLPDHSVDRAVCLSVFQYLNDEEVRKSLREFGRVLSSRGILIIHVKNLSSLYLATLAVAKKIKRLLGKKPRQEYVRTFGWYARTLRESGFEVVDYNSFDVFMVEKMPRGLLFFFRRLEMKNHNRGIFRSAFIRRRGYDLKIKALVATSA